MTLRVLIFTGLTVFGRLAAQERSDPALFELQSRHFQGAMNSLPRQVIPPNTIPLWSYSLTSPVDGQTYSGLMVGRDPSYHGHRATKIPTILLPVRFTFSDGTVLDPSSPDTCIGNNSVVGLVTNSPIFQNASYVMNGVDVGSTQYVDAFQRANFWSQVGGTPYHTLLDLTVGNTVNVTVNGPASTFGCGKYGTIDISSFDTLLQQNLIPAAAVQGVSSSTLPIFLLPNVFPCDGSSCAGGYHNAYNTAAIQTYVVATVDTTGRFGGGDIAALSHEVAEWMDDPAANNTTPNWGHVGQVTGCQANLEAGDPLTHSSVPPVAINGLSYHPQELAFFSWFFRQTPSIGAGGRYSNNGTFTTGAGVLCQ